MRIVQAGQFLGHKKQIFSFDVSMKDQESIEQPSKKKKKRIYRADRAKKEVNIQCNHSHLITRENRPSQGLIQQHSPSNHTQNTPQNMNK